MPTKMFLLVHPAARRRYPSKFEKLLHDLRSLDLETVETRDAADVTLQTRTALQAGHRTIVALGGDGMLSLCVQAFMEDGRNVFPDRRLLILPFGTGNDFFRGFVPKRKQGDLSWVSGNLMEKDIGLGVFSAVNGKPHYFINSFSVGMTTAIIQDYSQSRFRSYFLSTLRILWRFCPIELKVFHSGHWQRKSSLLLIVSKGTFVGGGMRFHRDADHEKGKGQVIWVPRISVGRAFLNIWKVYRGGVEAFPGVESFAFEKFSIDPSSQHYSVEADGELYPAQGPIEVRLSSATIRMLRPQT